RRPVVAGGVHVTSAALAGWLVRKKSAGLSEVVVSFHRLPVHARRSAGRCQREPTHPTPRGRHCRRDGPERTVPPGPCSGVRSDDLRKLLLEQVRERQRRKDLSLLAGGVGELHSPGGRSEPLQWRPVVPRVGELAVADLERRLLGLKNTLGVEREPASMR